jgi:CubicO group peptidase (beta-lactamase class C family)
MCDRLSHSHTSFGSLILYCAFGVLAVSEVPAQLIEPDEKSLAMLDQTITEYLEDNKIPGAVVAVASEGQLAHARAYGFANVELSVPVTTESVFEIGSISKQFVAAAVMLFVAEGKLDLDESIHRYLPELPGEWMGATTRQLLTHTSGIPDYEEIEGYDVYRFRLTPAEIIKMAHSRPMDFAPGKGWYYSNTGYYLVSMILERIEGKRLGEVLGDRIFKPLEMKQTRFADPEAIIPHRAAGYWINKEGELINRMPTETSSTLGAGGLLSSVIDLAIWDGALAGNKLLTEASKSEMWTPVEVPNEETVIAWDEGDYGFGWVLGDYLGHRTQLHYGQVAGFVAQFTRLPDLGISVVILTNRYQIRTAPMSIAVLHTFVPSLGLVPSE